jgi:hypothetical protein
MWVLKSRKRFVSYELFILFSYKDEISLVNLSKRFLVNRDTFCPYEKALNGTIGNASILIIIVRPVSHVALLMCRTH